MLDGIDILKQNLIGTACLNEKLSQNFKNKSTYRSPGLAKQTFKILQLKMEEWEHL